jgi:hypothetical protein
MLELAIRDRATNKLGKKRPSLCVCIYIYIYIIYLFFKIIIVITILIHILTTCTYLKSVLFFLTSSSFNQHLQTSQCLLCTCSKAGICRVKKLKLEPETMDGHYRLPIGRCCNWVGKFRVITYCYIYI